VFLNELQDYIDYASDDMEVCIVVRSLETAKVVGVTYNIVAEIGEYGELMMKIRV